MKNLSGMLKQAQKLQEQMQEMQAKLAETEMEGQAGGGMVTVTMNGKHEMRRVAIDPALVETAREGFEELTRKEGKPEQAIPKIVEGRVSSWYAERVLPEQGMFGDKETVQDRLGQGSIVRFALASIG